MSPTHNSSARILAAAAALAAGGIGCLAGPALAQCDVYRPGLPDFDQRREAAPGILGLPNNGSMHCVPTSAADAVAFAANHGAPGLTLGQQWDWDSPGTYNVATNLINTLGTLMGTNEDGTYSSGYVNGMSQFIDARAPGQFAVAAIGWANGFGPSPQRVHNIIADGGLVLIVRGTYAPEEAHPNILHRIGGHILLARNVYDACSPSPNIGMRDPNSSDSKFVNSPWGVYREDMNQFNATFRISGGSTQFRNYWEWSNNYGQNHKVMDGLLTFIPTFALTGVVINGEEAGINIIRPNMLAGLPSQPSPTRTVPLPEGLGPISSIELLPDLISAAVFTRGHHGGGGGAGKVIVHDISMATWHDGPEFATDVVDTCTSPIGVIYAAEALQISALTCLADGSVRVLNSSVSPNPVLACAFDDRANQLVVLARGTSGELRIQAWDPTFRGGVPVLDLPCPPNVVVDGPAGMCIDPNDGTFLVCSEGIPVIHRLEYDDAGRTVVQVESIPLPAGTAPRNPSVNGAGRIVYTGLESIVELVRNPSGGYTPLATGGFSGYTPGRSFALATSRDGITPSEQTGPDTTNILDERLESDPECAADFNDDGAVNSQDFFDFLSAFFGNDARADFNGNGTADSQDFFDFLRAFFGGC